MEQSDKEYPVTLTFTQDKPHGLLDINSTTEIGLTTAICIDGLGYLLSEYERRNAQELSDDELEQLSKDIVNRIKKARSVKLVES